MRRALTRRLDRRGWIALLAVAVAACVARGDLQPRHSPTGLQTPLPSADFVGYVEAAKAHIERASEGVRRPLQPELVAERAPFELIPETERCAPGADGRFARGALLIHGLGGTPYRMRDLAARLADRCHLVRAILLPGHGTVPGDLLDIDAAAWREAVRAGVASFADAAERVLLVGFGAGGTLALDYALFEANADQVPLTGLVLLAPALDTPTSLVTLATAGLYRRLKPEGSWLRLLPDRDPVAYESLPKNANIQLKRLIDRMQTERPIVDLPIFMAISADDMTVDPGAARAWFCRQLVGPRRLLWYTSEPAPSTDCRFVLPRPSAAASGVLDFSHLALPVAPGNPRYGTGGSYVDCLHYYWRQDSPEWLICLDPTKTPENSDVRYGEITEPNLQRYVVRRLTYNPDFEAITEAMLGFLDDLEQPAAVATPR